eukprot:CCRYP_015630-RB/>CCRYP_015630-RB protein AED:0.10 eAED:0.10 QI:102/1/1/1/0.8/0.83/6/374/178
MSGPLVKSLTLLSALLLTSAQLATFPRRLRRGSVSLDNEGGNGPQFAVRAKGEFGRARQLDSLSVSMTAASISFSLDLEPAAMEFDIEDETSMAAVTPTYYPSYVPTEKSFFASVSTATTTHYITFLLANIYSHSSTKCTRRFFCRHNARHSSSTDRDAFLLANIHSNGSTHCTGHSL